MTKKRKSASADFLLYGLLALFSLLVLAPFLFTVVHSLIPPEQVQNAYGNLGSGAIQLQLWPKLLGIRQYIRAFFGTKLEWYYYFHNTFLLSVPILLLTILLCTMPGYGLAKFQFWGRKALLTSCIIILLLPVQVTLVPFFIFFNGMHLMGSRFPLIAFCAFSPFGAFLIYQFIHSIPDSSIEAARLEGASEWQIFWRIVFPQATLGIAALTILTLIDCFSMIEQPFMLLREKSWYPCPSC